MSAPPGSKQSRATLSDFVKDNSTLITGVAAFAALTAFFSNQVKDVAIQAILPGFTLLGSFVMAFELFMRTPPPPRHWRLEVFEYVLVWLVFCVGWYWVETFPSLWVPFVAAIVNLVLVLTPSILLTWLFGIVVRHASRRVHKHLTEETVIRSQRVAFFLLLVFNGALYLWVGHKLLPHPVTLKLP